jgi:hypothetical protein
LQGAKKSVGAFRRHGDPGAAQSGGEASGENHGVEE